MPTAPRRRVPVLVTALVTVLVTGLALPAPAAYAGTGLPDGAPPAAHRAEPRLPTPDGWPFAQRLSRTAGTHRLYDGADYWTDFVDDDKGAAVPGGLSLQNTASLAPEQGVYEYPDGPAHGNGADVFVAATGVDDRASYWRVDWNTLADPSVPIAVWAFDTDDDSGTGTATWPAQAGVTSPGIDQALVVSATGAWLVDPATGARTPVGRRGGRLTVDRAAHSFVVRVPRRVLPVSGAWRVRVAAGLADATGRHLAPARTAGGAPVPPTYPRVYNVGFRARRQEHPVHTDSHTAALVAAYQRQAASSPVLGQVGADGQARFVTGNFWMEDNQADTLASGDVSRFSHVVHWPRLERRRSTPAPRPTGYSNRWYVSGLDLGQGTVENSNPQGDLRPNFLGRIQPYAVYVPHDYDPHRSRPWPLTWILHSLSVNHNQYGGYDPRLLQQLCERRGSVCATTNGYGPDGWYLDEAEVDFWSVWRELAQSYRLSDRRTVLGGYSMGGFATYQLGLAHPDLYAAAVTLAGPPQCGVSADGDQVGTAAGSGRCTTDTHTRPLLGNARWLPYRIGQGTGDELVPFTSVERQVSRFDELGLRHRFVRYPTEDHLVFATQDRFRAVVSGLGHPAVRRNPPRVDHTWYPHLTRPRLGIGATSAYWLERLRGRDRSPGTLAAVHARSLAYADRHHRVVRHGPTALTDPLPAVRTALSWRRATAAPTRRVLHVRAANVARLQVDVGRALRQHHACGRVTVRTDGPVRVRLTGLRDDAAAGGAGPARTSPSGTLGLSFDTGRHTVRIGC